MSSSAILKLPSKKRRESLDRATSEYSESVDLAADYLQSRGIPIEVARQWRLGVVLDPLPGHEEYKGRLSIPFLTPSGTVHMKFRCIADHKCSAAGCVKYLGESVQSRPFGVLSLQMDSAKIVVVEGELDTICAVSLAGVPALGLDGANKWKAHYKYMFEGYSEVVVVKDGDVRSPDDPKKPTSAERFADTVVGALYDRGARAVSMPPGEDTNSFIRQYGVEAWLDRIGWGDSR